MKWIKPNGVEIESNDRPGSIEMAKKAGWKPVEEIESDQDDSDTEESNLDDSDTDDSDTEE